MNKNETKKDVIISIKSSQKSHDNSDSIEFVTEGRYYKKDNHFYISYKESELTGLEGRTTLKVDAEHETITMMRSGVNSSHMVFEPRQTHCTHYDSGFGIFDMGITTKKMKINLSETEGDLMVKYTLDINCEYVSTNIIELNVKEATTTHGKSNTIS